MKLLDSMIPYVELGFDDVRWPAKMEKTGELVDHNSQKSFSYEFKAVQDKWELKIEFREG